MRIATSVVTLVVLAACTPEPQEVKTYQFEPNVRILLKVYDSGGALGETSYEAFYVNADKKAKFFQGSNPRKFSMNKNGEALEIKFCDGNVKLAQPIFIPSPNAKLIHINLIMNC